MATDLQQRTDAIPGLTLAIEDCHLIHQLHGQSHPSVSATHSLLCTHVNIELYCKLSRHTSDVMWPCGTSSGSSSLQWVQRLIHMLCQPLARGVH